MSGESAPLCSQWETCSLLLNQVGGGGLPKFSNRPARKHHYTFLDLRTDNEVNTWSDANLTFKVNEKLRFGNV